VTASKATRSRASSAQFGGNLTDWPPRQIGVIHVYRTVDQANGDLRASAAELHERGQADQFERGHEPLLPVAALDGPDAEIIDCEPMLAPAPSQQKKTGDQADSVPGYPVRPS
jgi:hypothetical protein